MTDIYLLAENLSGNMHTPHHHKLAWAKVSALSLPHASVCNRDHCSNNLHIHDIKSALEKVSNPVYCCINGVFCELGHDSEMNIIFEA